MHTLFHPESIVIIGLSSKANNIPRLILENLLRWGYKGRIVGVNPGSSDAHVDGIKMYKTLEDLPFVPDIAVALIPARFVPDTVEACGKFGIRRMSIPSGGFNELGEEGQQLADRVIALAQQYSIKFVGPNGITIANTYNGLCLPFVPSFPPQKGHFSFITQSGGVGLMLWNLLKDEQVGMAKFASIGNKLNLDEVDFLEYFGEDPETKVIGLYLESIPRGEKFIEVASRINKPIIVFKAGTTDAGKGAAMSHTAAVSSSDDVVNAAFEKAGVIRIENFRDFVSIAKAFELPPMRGKRLMVMSPAGGFTVMMADLAEKIGFEFADPGKEFFQELQGYANAGIINFSNPLDMGDIYDPEMYAQIFYSVMHNDAIDGAVYLSQWPEMPKGEDVFYKMFHTDISKETTGAILSSGKPLGVAIFGESGTIRRIKERLSFPIFNCAEEMLKSLRIQSQFYYQREQEVPQALLPSSFDTADTEEWIAAHEGDVGEEAMNLLDHMGVPVPFSGMAASSDEAVTMARKAGYPVVLKLVSPDALHKSDVGGVKVGIESDDEARAAYSEIEENLKKAMPDARFQGVRVAAMAREGIDMFVGARRDESFGPVVSVGYGGIYVEVFRDVQLVMAPARGDEIERALKKLKSWHLLQGARGGGRADIDALVDVVARVSHLMVRYEEIEELDCNPVRVFTEGQGAMALDVRLRITR